MAFTQFLNPTKEFHKHKILNLINENSNYTQRDLSSLLNVAVSTVNKYLDEYQNDDLIKRIHHTPKTVEYLLTNKGEELRKLLNIQYLSSTQSLYNKAKEDIKVYIDPIIKDDIKKLVLYGAGEVCELLLQTIKYDYKDMLEVVAIIDDNIDKQGQTLTNILISDISVLDNIDCDALLISSYTHRKTILSNLKNNKYNKRIIEFFN